MSKFVSIIAFITAISACVYSYQSSRDRQDMIDRALRQREAQLTQRYINLLRNTIDHSLNEAIQWNDGESVEEVIRKLGNDLRDELALRNRQSTIESEPSAIDTEILSVRAGSFQESETQAQDESQEANSEIALPSSVIQTVASVSEATQSTSSPMNGRIVFSSSYGRDSEIFVKTMPSGDIVQLTHNESEDISPSWSPDGRRMVFASTRGGSYDFDLYVMDAHGENVIRIAEAQYDHDDDYMPVWSPDGLSIAFARKGLESKIHIFNLDGKTEPRPLIDGTDPCWSPDGSEIAFTQGEDIAVTNTKGSKVEPFFKPSSDGKQSSCIHRGCVWSPDGNTALVYSICAEDHNETNDATNPVGKIYRVDRESRRRTRLTDGPGHDYPMDWSPDGRQIVFLSDRDGQPRLYTMNADGSNVKRLTGSDRIDSHASWGIDPDTLAHGISKK